MRWTRSTAAADRRTIIALRATHTVHRVACDVAYPELMEKPRQVLDARPVIDYDPSLILYRARRRNSLLVPLLVIFAILLIFRVAYQFATQP